MNEALQRIEDVLQYEPENPEALGEVLRTAATAISDLEDEVKSLHDIIAKFGM